MSKKRRLHCRFFSETDLILTRMKGKSFGSGQVRFGGVIIYSYPSFRDSTFILSGIQLHCNLEIQSKVIFQSK